MAICLSFMVGRFGGVAGSNVSAILFADYCASAFYVPGLALIGKLNIYDIIRRWHSHLTGFQFRLLQGVQFYHTSFQTYINRFKQQSCKYVVIYDVVHACMCALFIVASSSLLSLNHVVMRHGFVITTWLSYTLKATHLHSPHLHENNNNNKNIVNKNE